jgi:N-acetylglutamate synthase/N-acetylornithine aminotransferase
VYASLRAAGKKADLSLVVADEPAVAAGCFTKNVMCAAPVLYCKDVLDRKQKVKAVSSINTLCMPGTDSMRCAVSVRPCLLHACRLRLGQGDPFLCVVWRSSP